MDTATIIHLAIRYGHIAVGAVGLLVFWVPVFARKGGSLHIACGRVFAWCGYLVGARLLASELALGIAALGLAVFGVWPLVEGGGYRYALPLGLGAFGVAAAISDLRFIAAPRPTRMAWWYKHMDCMLGAGIAFHTAFLVFGARRILGEYLTGPWQLVPWILPALVGVPATAIWIRYYRRKFGEAGTVVAESV